MVKIKLLTCLAFFIFCQCAHGRSLEETKTDDSSNRESRYFPFWNVGKNSGMTCTSMNGMQGTCQTSKYCKIKGGLNIGIGTCAGNNEVCCQFSAKCPSVDTEPCIIRDSGSLITQEAGVYRRRYQFPRIKGACQLKLELTTLMLSPPSATGNCENDTLSISGSPTVKHFTICGSIAEKQELYFEFGTSENINMDINIRQVGAMFNIRPTFIRCDSTKRVPGHCLQYFTGQTGQVKSFNEGLQQLNNLDYTVCVHPLDESSSIKWKECGVDKFVITGNLGNPIGAAEGDKCVTDWVEIFGGKRHCGTAFTETTSVAKPFLLQVHFDDNDRPMAPSNNFIPGPNCTSPNPEIIMCMTYPDPTDPALLPICQCTFPSLNTMNIDAQNTGFCLNYMQV